MSISTGNGIEPKRAPQGCPKCAGNSVPSTENFVSRAKAIHQDKYIYEVTEYVDAKTPVKIVCRYHGQFQQKPGVHLSGSGCPRCRSSRGEYVIEKHLRKNGISFVAEYSFSDCRLEKPLPFDFLVEVNGMTGLIEFNGEQHYREIINSPFQFLKIQKRDQIKIEYCAKKGIPLLVVRFDQIESAGDLVDKFLEGGRSLKSSSS